MSKKQIDYIALIKIAWKLVSDYGPEVVSLLDDVVGSIKGTERVTHCPVCKQELPMSLIKAGGVARYEWTCPTHGTKDEVLAKIKAGELKRADSDPRGE